MYTDVGPKLYFSVWNLQKRIALNKKQNMLNKRKQI